jgi:hypothetical protein
MGEIMRRATALLVREVGGEILVLDTEADQIHQLNHTASMIWRLLESGAEVPEIADALVNEYDLHRDQADADVLATVNRFSELNLLDYVKSGSAAAAE